MPRDQKSFNSFEGFGKHFGIEPEENYQEQDYSKKTPFFGREEELLRLNEFIENPNPKSNIFGLYGVPMVGKSLLVEEFIKRNKIATSYLKLPVVFKNPNNPETTLVDHILGNKKISELSYDRPTLIFIQNFEECLEWKGSLKRLHSIRVKFPKIGLFLKKVYGLPNVKVIIESRFQINTPELEIELTTLPGEELVGVDTKYFKKLYLQAGVSEEEFEIICERFSRHTWLLSKAYQDKNWIYKTGLNKAASRPKSVTSYLWDLLNNILYRMQKSETLIMCGLTLKPSMLESEIQKEFENLKEFKDREVFESLDSLERKFLIKEVDDKYEINPYIREICFSFMKRSRSRTIDFLKMMDCFKNVSEPYFDEAKQKLESGNYGGFYKQVHFLQKRREYDKAHEILQYALESDTIIKRVGVLSEMAITYKKQGDFNKAIETLKKGLEYDSSDVMTKNELAVTYKEQGNYEKAIEILQELVEENHIPAYTELAIVYKEQRKYDSAIKILTQLTKLGHMQGFNVLAKLYKDRGEYEKAIKVLNEALVLDSKDVISLNQLSNIYKDQGNLSEAIKTLKLALSYDKNDTASLNDLAINYLKTNENTKAIQILEDLVSKKHIPSFSVLAIHYKKNNELSKALEIINKAISIDKRDRFFSRMKREIHNLQNNGIGKPKRDYSPRKKKPNYPRKELNDLLSNDNIRQFLKKYSTLVEELGLDDLQNEIILQSSKFVDIEKQKEQGSVSFDNYMMTKTQIRVSLLSMLKKLEKKL